MSCVSGVWLKENFVDVVIATSIIQTSSPGQVAATASLEHCGACCGSNYTNGLLNIVVDVAVITINHFTVRRKT